MMGRKKQNGDRQGKLDSMDKVIENTDKVKILSEHSESIADTNGKVIVSMENLQEKAGDVKL